MAGREFPLMLMRRALPWVGPLLALAACNEAPPLVTTKGVPPSAPGYAVTGDTPAAAEVRRQLQARGRYAGDGGTMIRTGYAAAPRGTGTCQAQPVDGICAEWLDTPQTGWAPFAPPLRYRLTLAMEGGQVVVIQAGDKQETPLPIMVSAALDRLLALPTGQP
jgi:hypothetical protein